MTIIITAIGVGAALLLFSPTRTIGGIVLLLVSYIFPTIDLALAGILLVGMVLNVC